MAETQKQSSGDNSVNIQAGQVVVGANYGEIRQIARDVFDANFYRLAQVAKETATQRAEAITECFLHKLEQNKTNIANCANDPDFQYSLFTAQKEFARSGDQNLGDVLVDILVDRAKETEKSLKQIVLNESLITVSKLTPQQWDALTLIFLTKYVQFGGMANLEAISQKIQSLFVPFIENLPANYPSYQHMEYAGCGALSVGSAFMESIWQTNYPGLFTKGFTEEQFKAIAGNENFTGALLKCLRDQSKLQFKAINKSVLEGLLKQNGVSEETIKKALDLHVSNLMTAGEIKSYFQSLHPLMEKFFKLWTETGMEHFTLTSVGIAIAHANLRRKTNESMDLGIWIN